MMGAYTDRLGFSELCVCCDVSLAQERNKQRQIPIPNSTIIDMEQSLELPDSSKYQWEKKSCVLFNNSQRDDFLTEARSVWPSTMCQL